MNKLTSILLLIITSTFTGCASNPYSKFYTPYNYNTEKTVQPHTNKVPAIYANNQSEVGAIIMRLNIAGYEVLGQSSWYGKDDVPEEKAGDHAREIGANKILIVSPNYKETKSGSIPITIPTTASSYHSGNISNTYGGDSYSYNGTTTTHGTSTTHVPYHVDIFTHQAYFLSN